MSNLNPDAFNPEYVSNPQFYPKFLMDKEKATSYVKESYISQEPSEYFREETNVKPQILALFSLYEEKQREIYEIINKNDPAVLLEVDSTIPNATFIDIFSDESTYNKDRICLKTPQEIPCTEENSTVESYIIQCKKDWNRAQYFSSKYNKYFINLPGKPYVDDSPAKDKLFLITVDAINTYLMSDVFYLSLPISNSEQVEPDLGTISCDCKKTPDNHLICESFTHLQIPNEKVKKILYNLSAFDQGPKHAVLSMFLSGVYETYYDKYIQLQDLFEGIQLLYTINSDVNCTYFDAKNKALVTINQINLIVEQPNSRYGVSSFMIPLYNVIKINPVEINDYYYTFLYVINEPPAIIGDQSKWYEKKSTVPITSMYYKFLEDKIKMYMDKAITQPDDFNGFSYAGADLLSYINKKATDFTKTHKPYVSPPYKSPKFVPPEKTLLTSPRVLGGKTRRRRNNYRRKTTRKVRKNKTIRRQSIRRKSIRRKSIRRKSIRRPSIRRQA
jgi:hypothetical protein